MPFCPVPFLYSYAYAAGQGLNGSSGSSKSKNSSKVNLLIFLTCRLINPDGSPIREREMRGLPPFRY